MFVVDSAHAGRLEEARCELASLLKMEELSSAPLLVFANKQVHARAAPPSLGLACRACSERRASLASARAVALRRIWMVHWRRRRCRLPWGWWAGEGPRQTRARRAWYDSRGHGGSDGGEADTAPAEWRVQGVSSHHGYKFGCPIPVDMI